MKRLKLDKEIHLILDILNRNGRGYIVGGYVRDELLGLKPKDCDFVTSIPYEKLLELFKEYSPKEIGKHFGIIQIKIGRKTYEIAKLREDIGIPSKRQEQEIRFTDDIYEDLKRRDFTINAIAYDGKDYYYHKESLEDIENRRLRFIGDMETRIKEDPLRILRAFRFLATKPLTSGIDLEIVKKNLDLLDTLSVERIKDEFNRLLLEKELKIFETIDEIGLLEKIIPPWKTRTNRSIEVLKKSSPKLSIRLAIFFKYLEDGEKSCKKEMKRLTYSKKTIDRTLRLISYKLEDISELSIKKAMNYFKEEEIEDYLNILKLESETLEERKTIRKIEREVARIKAMNIPYRKEEVALSGKDLIEEFNIKGKMIGEILEYLYEVVLLDYRKNNKETLLLCAASRIETLLTSYQK